MVLWEVVLCQWEVYSMGGCGEGGCYGRNPSKPCPVRRTSENTSEVRPFTCFCLWSPSGLVHCVTCDIHFIFHSCHQVLMGFKPRAHFQVLFRSFNPSKTASCLTPLNPSSFSPLLPWGTATTATLDALHRPHHKHGDPPQVQSLGQGRDF